MDVVTGAFSYTGRAIAEELLLRGRWARTLSRRDAPADPLAERIERAELQFRDERALRRALAGTDTLYNTYWVRFAHGATTFDRAVENTRVLLRAAREAGVQRIVHVSVTSSSLDSALPYFRAKAQVEEDVRASGLAWAIVRRTPVFPVAGDGRYRVQPVSVEDVARICADAVQLDEVVLDAAGPDTLTYEELVRLVAAAVGSRARIVYLPPRAVLALARITGMLRRDVLLTREELAGLQRELLVSTEPPLGTASFRSWVAANGESLGRGYVSELARNFRPYDPI